MKMALFSLLVLLLSISAYADISGLWDASTGISREKECIVRGGVTVYIAEDTIRISNYTLVCSNGSVSKRESSFLVQDEAIFKDGEKVGEITEEGFMISYDTEELYIGKLTVILNASLQNDGTLLLNEINRSNRGNIFDVRFFFNKNQ